MVTTISVALFGTTPAGEPIDLYTLRNANGIEARICTYGGIVTSILAPDRDGKFADVALGFDNLAAYVERNPYFGCFVGRYGNRIAAGRFTLDGVSHQLACNNPPNALHGGVKGFDKVVWQASVVPSAAGPILRLKYLSRDGEEGFPGNLAVTADYTLTADNGLRLDYTATTDKPTIVALTQHSYYNLAGEGRGDVLGHRIQINAEKFTPIDRHLIPTGELRAVAGTPMDLRQPVPIGAGIDSRDEQVTFAGGFDHNWIIDKPAGALGLQARVVEPTSGRTLEVLSTEPGVQFYSGNFLHDAMIGKGGKVYARRSGFCLEPQHFPDSPNKPHFPTTVLRPGERYASTIIYRFGVQR